MPVVWIIAWVNFQQSNRFLFFPQLKEEPGKSSLEVRVLRLRLDRLLGDLKSLNAAPLSKGLVQSILVMTEDGTQTFSKWWRIRRSSIKPAGSNSSRLLEGSERTSESAAPTNSPSPSSVPRAASVTIAETFSASFEMLFQVNPIAWLQWEITNVPVKEKTFGRFSRFLAPKSPESLC